MTKQQKIIVLNELLADKTLSFGCEIGEYIRPGIDRWRVTGKGKYTILPGSKDYWVHLESFDGFCRDNVLVRDIKKILGHPVTLAAILEKVIEISFDLASENYWIRNRNRIVGYYDLKNDTLEAQSEITINFLYKLFIK